MVIILKHGLNTLSNTQQELRSWEEALARAAEEQRTQEELLKRREQELAEREIDIVERELNIIIHQMYQEKPHVKKRKGHFKKSRLLKLGRDSNCISLPSGGLDRKCNQVINEKSVYCMFLFTGLLLCFSCVDFEHKITVQASPSVDKRKSQGSESTTPPASPGVIPRLRAIRCEYMSYSFSVQDLWSVQSSIPAPNTNMMLQVDDYVYEEC